MDNHNEESLYLIARLNRDMMKALQRDMPGGVTARHARYLVDDYYQAQEGRIRNGNRIKGLDRDAIKASSQAEPHESIDMLHANYAACEENIKKVLTFYVQTHDMAWFFERTLGCGPIIAAGLLAHIDIARCPTVGHLWRFSGYDPTQSWIKKDDVNKLWDTLPGDTLEAKLAAGCLELGREYASALRMATTTPDGKSRKLTEETATRTLARKPFNGTLKTLCWKLGDSFVKLKNRQDSYYSQVYVQRKAELWRRNLAGELQDAASARMQKKGGFKKSTDQYIWYSGQINASKAAAMLVAGETPTAADCKDNQPGQFPMLSPAHIDNQARRYAVKLFLSHLHECWYRQHFGKEPPAPFALAIQGHAHYLPPPQLDQAEAEAA